MSTVRVELLSDLTSTKLQEILRRSLTSSSLTVTEVRDPEELSGVVSYGSNLRKLVAVVEDEGMSREIHLVAKAAIRLWYVALPNVWFNMFIFFRESLFFSTAIPELSKLVTTEQAVALEAVLPKVHHAYCNYDEDNLSRCCLFKPKEKGVILMENLMVGEEKYVDMKEIEKTSGGGVKTAHMRMVLEGLAHFHGAWMVWMRKGDGLGNKTKAQILDLFKQQDFYKYRWIWKWTIKKFMTRYSILAEAKNDQSTKEKVDAFMTSPETVDKFIKAFGYENSHFKTITHSDFHTGQVMFSLNKDGSPKNVKILDFQGLTIGHPGFDIWTMVYSATDPEYRATHLEADLRAYYDIISTYMEECPDFTQFMQELEENRILGMTMFGGTMLFLTLCPTPLPSPTKEFSKFSKACNEILLAEDKEDDHPDIREIRRRVTANLKEMVDLGHI